MNKRKSPSSPFAQLSGRMRKDFGYLEPPRQERKIVPPPPPPKSHMAFGKDQTRVVEAFEKGENLFFTGPAGSGKSEVMKHCISLAKKKYGSGHVAIVASTGIAAVNIGGCTLHHFAGAGLGTEPLEKIVTKILRQPWVLKRWIQTRVLFLDEISMLDASYFTLIDEIGQRIRQSSKPFGGIQIVATGDFLQLPPISKTTAPPFCFTATNWNAVFPNVIYMKEIFRQASDAGFQDILANLRIGKITDEQVATLSKQLPSASTNATKLYPLRKDVEMENLSQLAKLPGREYIFTAKDQGTNDMFKSMLDKNCIALPSLILKIGAQVILVCNLDFETQLVNGSRGIVTGFSKIDDLPIVDFGKHRKLIIDHHDWNIEEQGKCVATRTQIPLILAWALSIHKSQGMTLDDLEIDLAQSFGGGMAYVGISRVRTISSLVVKNLSPSKITADPTAIAFYSALL